MLPAKSDAHFFLCWNFEALSWQRLKEDGKKLSQFIVQCHCYTMWFIVQQRLWCFLKLLNNLGSHLQTKEKLLVYADLPLTIWKNYPTKFLRLPFFLASRLPLKFPGPCWPSMGRLRILATSTLTCPKNAIIGLQIYLILQTLFLFIEFTLKFLIINFDKVKRCAGLSKTMGKDPFHNKGNCERLFCWQKQVQIS